VAQPTLWAGIDAGKAAHHCVAMNADGQHVLSRRVVMKELCWVAVLRRDSRRNNAPGPA
jgi:hypothetical protein